MSSAIETSVESNWGMRKRWEEPKVVLERSLLVSAQEGDPGAPPVAPGAPVGPSGFLGPLGTSGGSGSCL